VFSPDGDELGWIVLLLHIASGSRFTCLIVGFSHYEEPVAAVMGEVFRRLEGQPPEAR